MENKFREIFVKRNRFFPVVAYTTEVPESDKYIEIAAVEQLKAENKRLNKLAEGILTREESIYAEHELRIEIESENASLKSKLKIASDALEVVKVHNGINSHYPIVWHSVNVALLEIGGEM